MAEGSTSEITGSDQSTSMTEGRDLLCEPCLEDGQQLPAEGYCITCVEHLCDHCFSCHTVPRNNRKHILQNKLEMSNRTSTRGGIRTSSYKCQTHNQEPVTSYCTSHDRLCCEKCVSVCHQVCKDVQPIDRISANMRGSEEFDQFVEILSTLRKRNESNKQKAVLNTERIDACYNRCVDDFSATICKIKGKDKSKNAAIQSSIDNVLQQITAWQADIERHQKNKDDSSLFILMKSAGNDVKLMETNTDHLEKENKIEAHGFLASADPCLIGKVLRTPYRLNQINVKHSSEGKTCQIRGLAVLKDGRLLVSDECNQTIKLVNMESDSIDAVVKLNSYPWQMTLMENGEVYVTQPDVKKILHFPSPTDDLNVYKEISVEFRAWSILHYKSTLIVDQRSDPFKIIEMDLDGKVKKSLSTNRWLMGTDQKKHVLNDPRHMTFGSCRSDSSIVISDQGGKAIVGLQNDGKFRLIVKSKYLDIPCGIVIDHSDGSYLVCCYYDKRVVRVTDSGEMFDVITGLSKPVVLALDKDKQRLYIGGDCDHIDVYQL